MHFLLNRAHINAREQARPHLIALELFRAKGLMDTRKLLSNAVLYGLADAIVLVVGGFLLLPLYTRTLSQSEYGIYVIVRANVEILTYLLYLGLPSAVARVYFVYKKTGQQLEYLSSVVMFFLLCLVGFVLVLIMKGAQLWSLVSPTTPVTPYLIYCVAIAAVGFFAAIATMWLRMEGRAIAFAGVQVASAVVLAASATLFLVRLKDGLPGLLSALLISAACSAMVLPVLFGRRFRVAINWEHIAVSMRYASPVLVGYIAFFVLNRISTLILQRHVPVDQIAIFGLAQQLATIVTIAATAFAMAMQPAVFGAESENVVSLLRRSAKILLLLIFSLTSVLLLFGAEIFSLVAPVSYSGGYEIMLILLVANFANSFNQISNTALLYHHRPKTSAAVSIFGAMLAAGLGMWLIPRFQLHGAAFASMGAICSMTLLSHWLARRASGYSCFGRLGASWVAIGALALLATLLARQNIPLPAMLSLKAGICILILMTTYFFYIRKPCGKPCNP
jgi:O-antigen/teichoic acid export membrane protein